MQIRQMIKQIIREELIKNRLNEGKHLSSPEVEFDFKNYNWQYVKPLFAIIEKVHGEFNIEYEYNWDEKKLWLNYDDFIWAYKNEEMSNKLRKDMNRVIYELEKLKR